MKDTPTLIIIPTLDAAQGQDTGRLAQLHAGCPTRLIVSHSPQEDGFTKSVNRGWQQAKVGEDVCLLNDDVYRFTYGWLRALKNALYSASDIGIVVPSGHSASSPDTGRLGHVGLTKVNTAPFWCALIRSEVADSLGMLDERLIHYSSDTWYCVRVRRAGWRIKWLRSVYLWHEHEGSGFRESWRRHDTEVFTRLLLDIGLNKP